MDIFNKKKIRYLEIEIIKLWADLAEKEKTLKNLRKSPLDEPDLEQELREIALKLCAIIDYLGVEFKEEWIEDSSFIPHPESRQIKTLKAVKKPLKTQ